MSKIIEYTLVSVDGAHSDPAGLGFMRFRDDAYLRDGLGVLYRLRGVRVSPLEEDRSCPDAAAVLWLAGNHVAASRGPARPARGRIGPISPGQR